MLANWVRALISKMSLSKHSARKLRATQEKRWVKQEEKTLIFKILLVDPNGLGTFNNLVCPGFFHAGFEASMEDAPHQVFFQKIGMKVICQSWNVVSNWSKMWPMAMPSSNFRDYHLQHLQDLFLDYFDCAFRRTVTVWFWMVGNRDLIAIPNCFFNLSSNILFTNSLLRFQTVSSICAAAPCVHEFWHHCREQLWLGTQLSWNGASNALATWAAWLVCSGCVRMKLVIWSLITQICIDWFPNNLYFGNSARSMYCGAHSWLLTSDCNLWKYVDFHFRY